MTSDLDIYRSAQELVRQHGDRAGLVEATKAEDLMAGGDPEGAAVWCRIVSAIVELRRLTPPKGSKPN